MTVRADRWAGCSVQDCDSDKPGALGLCMKHYTRKRRHGDVNYGPGEWPSIEARLRRNTVITGFCWLWVGARNGWGYGAVRLRGKNRAAHRWVYELLVGPIPEGLELDHLCKVKNCVNPDPVTRVENQLRAAPSIRRWCANGHDLADPSVAYLNKKGRRRCRSCLRESRERALARKVAA